ncbi:alpha/beta hydrolase [Streptosporangium sp. NPDC049046]|uniref:alpha/beta fold hydrolase n=1 Tax=unclassified Streptosporangium TaxID=2632669 RepID=UPI003442A944
MSEEDSAPAAEPQPPPSDAPATVWERRRYSVGGLGLHVRSAGTGTPTVFLHGGGPGCSAWTDFAPVVDALTPGRRLILVDLPQYGDSDKPPITAPLFGFHAAHVRGLLDTLGVTRADFVCQSLGGGVALRLAADHPESVGRLVVTGSRPTARPAPGAGDARGPRLREDYYGGVGPTRAKMRELIARYEWTDPSGVPEETVAERYRNSVDPGALALGTATEARGAAEDLGPDLARVTSPVLLLWGEHDAFAGLDYARHLLGLLADARLEVVPGTAHHPQEERPAEYAERAAAFLTSLPDRESHPRSSTVPPVLPPAPAVPIPGGN